MSSKKSAEQVAEALEVGTSTVYNIRNGYFLPGLDLANKIAEVSHGKVPTSTWKGAKIRPRVRKTSRKAA